jgi:hypothetical protein
MSTTATTARDISQKVLRGILAELEHMDQSLGLLSEALNEEIHPLVDQHGGGMHRLTPEARSAWRELEKIDGQILELNVRLQAELGEGGDG